MSHIRIISLFSAFLLFGAWGFGQSFAPKKIDFVKNGQVLQNPLVGGLDSPQLSEVDLNDDNIMDLFIFDKVGNVVITYLNGGTANEMDYTYAPEYIEQFPELKGWALLRDYNGDGIMDIFSYSDLPVAAGIIVHTGFIENGKIAFKRLNFYDYAYNILPFELPGGGFSNLYVSNQDIPAIDDIDGDGDLDVVTFAVNGGYVHLYNNESVEKGFGLDSLKYTWENCFGGIYESGLTGCICLPESPGDCCVGFDSEGTADTRHAGSTLLTFFNDPDDDKELVLGDLSFTNVVLLNNTGNNETAVFGEQDCNFPSYDLSVDIPIFPATFHIDLNNDGFKDFIAAPNTKSNAENYEVVWYYQNEGNNSNPVFEFQKKDLLIEDMLDMGSGSNPVFVDYNQDGLMDLVVGTYSFYQPLGERDARLFLYENTGTVSQPQFTLINDDYLNFSNFSTNAWTFSPAFGDIDNDGDFDLVVGEEFGGIFYAENIAGAGNTFDFGSVQYSYFDIDVGQVSTPQIVDVDRDGKPDLVVGERNGNLNFFKNIGTPQVPEFHPEEDEAPNNPFFGEVDVRLPGAVTGYSSPVFIDFDGEFRLYCGTQSGFIRAYTNIDDNLEGAFTAELDFYGGDLGVGERSHVTFYDIDGNNVLDMLLGNFRGGLNGFNSDLNVDGTVVSTQYLGSTMSYNIYPNPVDDQLHISMNNLKGQTAAIRMYNAIGQLIFETNTNQSSTSIFVNNQAPGLYLMEIKVGGERKVEKVVVK